MRESKYWLRVLVAISNISTSDEELNQLIKEPNELKNTHGSIAQESRTNGFLIFIFLYLPFIL